MLTSRLVLGLLCCVLYVSCKPNGAPTDSCFYMTPRHLHPHTYRRVYPTRSMGLYNLTVSSRTYRPDRGVKVTLWGPPFKGFMLVAAENGAKDWPTGMFYSEDGTSKRLTCLQRGDTVTHQNNTYKDSISVLWYGPENMVAEHIQFIATVVVNMTIYYTNIKSRFLRLDPMLNNQQQQTEGQQEVMTMMDPWLSGSSVTKSPLWGPGSQGQSASGIDSLLNILGAGGSASQSAPEGAGEASSSFGGGSRWRSTGTGNGWGNTGSGGSMGDSRGGWNNWGNQDSGTTQSWWGGTTYNPYSPTSMYTNRHWQQRRTNVVMDPPREGAILWSPEHGWSAWAQPNPLPPITRRTTTTAPPRRQNAQPKRSESMSSGVYDLLSTLLRRIGAM